MNRASLWIQFTALVQMAYNLVAHNLARVTQ